MPKAPKASKVVEEEVAGPSKKELRAQKKALKKDAMSNLQKTRAEQDRMLGHQKVVAAADEEQPETDEAPSA